MVRLPKRTQITASFSNLLVCEGITGITDQTFTVREHLLRSRDIRKPLHYPEQTFFTVRHLKLSSSVTFVVLSTHVNTTFRCYYLVISPRNIATRREA